MSIVLFDHAGIGVADRDGGSDLTKCSARQLFCWRVYPPHVGPSRNNLGVVLCQDGSTFRDRVPYSAHRPIVDTGGRSPGTKRGASADRGLACKLSDYVSGLSRNNGRAETRRRRKSVLVNERPILTR